MSRRPMPRNAASVRTEDLARAIYQGNPDLGKLQWGIKLREKIASLKEVWLDDWHQERGDCALGEYVAKVKARDLSSLAPKVSYAGVAMRMTPTISVRTSQGRQLKLWYEVSPTQWVEAARRLNREARGRLEQATLRLGFAAVIEADENLMQLETIAKVAERMKWDLNDLNLGGDIAL